MGRPKVERIEVVCGTCGRVLLERASRNRKFCSKKCEGIATAAKYAAARTMRTCEVCGKEYKLRPGLVKSNRFCSVKCANPVKSRETAAKRGNKMRFTGKGKTYVKFHSRHLHRVVAEKKLGRALIGSEVVHHRDGNKRNNDPENLEILPSQAEHARLHAIERHKK